MNSVYRFVILSCLYGFMGSWVWAADLPMESLSPEPAVVTEKAVLLLENKPQAQPNSTSSFTNVEPTSDSSFLLPPVQPVVIPPDLPASTPSPVQPFFWQPSQRVEQQTLEDHKGRPTRQVTTTFTPRADDTSKQIPFLAIGALNQQTLFYINPTPSGQGKEDDPDWFQRTLLYQSMRAMHQAQGFNANHFDYVKVRVVYDARFEDRKGRPRHYLMQRDIKLNFEDIRWYATPRRLSILSNAELERKLALSARSPFPSWLGRQMLTYQPTQRVKAIVMFVPGQSQSTFLSLLQGILGLGAQFGAISAGVRAGD